MRAKGFNSRVSFITAVSLHGIVFGSGFMSFTDLKNALLHFYCVWWRINDARKLFDEMPQRIDVVSFGTLTNGCLEVSKACIGSGLVQGYAEKLG
ncbi:unnamed protein product [Arabis nemorensis]|uniref:Pentatricopeptide repeat-containing protein n=1 Tax=Arabis nemorensis TaxID=586526 RepID=A0A565CBD6_9BRAS|nr:unnamed protein product [Arabis nemorensis]